MLSTFRKCSLSWIVILSISATSLTFGQSSSTGTIGSIKFQILDLRVDLASLENRVRVLENELKKSTSSTSNTTTTTFYVDNSEYYIRRNPSSYPWWNDTDLMKDELLKMRDAIKSLVNRIQVLEKEIKKSTISSPPRSAQTLNIEIAAPNTWDNPKSLLSSSVPVSWNHTGKMEVHVYCDGNLILKELHSSGDIIKFPPNKVVELKVWIPGSPTPFKSLWVSTP